MKRTNSKRASNLAETIKNLGQQEGISRSGTRKFAGNSSIDMNPFPFQTMGSLAGPGHQSSIVRQRTNKQQSKQKSLIGQAFYAPPAPMMQGGLSNLLSIN